MSPGATASLNSARRAEELGRLADGAVVDVLVVGLGVTGAGVALDAASRGLSVAAIDAHDLAYGTSRWSSKLVHGGLRYLASGDVAVAYECARERGILMTRTAPHIARPVPVIMPLTTGLPRRTARIHRAALAAGDLLRRAARTPTALLPRARRIDPASTLRLAGGLRRQGLRGANLNWDGQLEDDARLVTAIARTAAGHGAWVITRCRALQLDGDGAEVLDELSGQRLRIRARSIVNAAGVWADRLVDGIALRPSRGTHVVVRTASLGGLTAELTVPIDGRPDRFVIAVPQAGGLAYVGLTDEPVDGPIEDVPQPPEADIDFLLGHLNPALERPLGRTDVVGAFAGLRPLLDDGRGDARTADMSRRHVIAISGSGVVTVVGGKLTTYRVMAEQAVDAAIQRNGLPARKSGTAALPLVGAAPPNRLRSIEAPLRLVRRYGTEAIAVQDLARTEPDLAQPVAPGSDITGAEVVWANRHEGALTADDILDRRTRIGLISADRALALPAVQRLLAR